MQSFVLLRDSSHGKEIQKIDAKKNRRASGGIRWGEEEVVEILFSFGIDLGFQRFRTSR